MQHAGFGQDTFCIQIMQRWNVCWNNINCQGDKYPVCTAYAQAPDIVEIWGMPNTAPVRGGQMRISRRVQHWHRRFVIPFRQCPKYFGTWNRGHVPWLVGRISTGTAGVYREISCNHTQSDLGRHEPDYPLHSRYTLQSLYDSNRVTYIYDLTAYDYVCIVTDAPEPPEKWAFQFAVCIGTGWKYQNDSVSLEVRILEVNMNSSYRTEDVTYF